MKLELIEILRLSLLIKSIRGLVVLTLLELTHKSYRYLAEMLVI